MTIGIIDSGLGGYSIYHALHKAYPKASFHFLADQKNAPYGNKTAEEIKEIAKKNIAWFKSKDIHEIVIACNTMNAVALDSLKLEFPEIKFYDVVYPTVKQLEAYQLKRILVVATRLTIQSNIYAKTIQTLFPDINVKSVALPDLVQKIEGLCSHLEITEYIQFMLNEDDLKCDGLILACTHYPIVNDAFSSLFHQKIMDSIKAMVEIFKDKVLDEGESRCFTTKDPIYAKHQVNQLFRINEDFSKIEV